MLGQVKFHGIKDINVLSNKQQLVNIPNQKLVRDVKSKALVSTDFDGLKAYKERRKLDARLRKADTEINNINKNIEFIKSLVVKLAEINKIEIEI